MHGISEEKTLQHFGVPGMKWGVRRAARYDKRISKNLAKADALEKKGTKTSKMRALIKRDNAKVYSNRKENVLAIAKVGEKIKKGSSFMNKLTGMDIANMSAALAKGKYTVTEQVLSAALSGSNSIPMRQLIRDRTIYGMD